MPNIIENYIVISGPKEDLELFKEVRLRYNQKAIWLDEGDEPADEDYFGFDLQWESKGDPIAFRTQTAWAYPYEALEKASAEWPTLRFHLKEVGSISDGGFADIIYQGGEVVVDEREVGDIVDFVSEVRGAAQSEEEAGYLRAYRQEWEEAKDRHAEERERLKAEELERLKAEDLVADRQETWILSSIPIAIAGIIGAVVLRTKKPGP
jgi:hypothetical protein